MPSLIEQSYVADLTQIGEDIKKRATCFSVDLTVISVCFFELRA